MSCFNGCLYEKKLDTLEDRLGETRIVTKTIIFPKTLKGVRKWGGKAKIIQMVCKRDVGGSMEWGKYSYKWHDIEWVD